VPDATELELIAQRLREVEPQSVLDTVYFRDRATLLIEPAHNRAVLRELKGRGYTFMCSVHGLDYYPEEPRLGIVYELLDMARVDRIAVKARVTIDRPTLPSVTPDWPTADHQEREIYDMFGVVFEGHPDLRRILMPEDYEGHPQRRDFPVGGEPVMFTYNEGKFPRYYE
jgi:NADH-quinone oxidoreductase subunit C